MNSRHAMPFGAQVLEQGVRFAIWAPAARRVELHLAQRSPLTMQPHEDGFHTCVVNDASAGDRYSFSFDDDPLRVADPASRFNPDGVHRASEVVNPGVFEWQDDEWAGRPWRETVLYELHVGTFTPEGTYAAAEARLDYLADVGVTAVELMPVADGPGRRNWGYDGVLQFAPRPAYGRPDELKHFVQRAHERGLMVFLDVVYNHFGPEGNYLHLYAPQFFTDRHKTPWGSAINFDGPNSGPVRQFFIHNALYWLEEYHFDGLRFDAVHAIIDDSEPSFLQELAQTVEQLATRRRKHLVLENGDNVARYLQRDSHVKAAGSYDAQWNDDFHHSVHVLVTGESSGYYQDYDRPAERLLRCLTEGFAYQGEPSKHWGGRPRGEPSKALPPEAFVNFLQNHDQIGNRAMGERLWMLANASALQAAETLLLLLPTPILLFMGDEFHAPDPFPFFCDFTGELATAVTEGRREEFADFFSAAELETIPDPNDEATFDRARLDWTAVKSREGAAALKHYRRLLRLRHEVLIPRLPAAQPRGRMLAERALTAAWDLYGGTRLVLVANMSDRKVAAEIAPAGDLLVSSAPLPARLPGDLPPWCVAWFLQR